MQEENQLATVAADPPQTSDPPVIEQEQPEGGEHQEQQQTTEQQPEQKPQVSPEMEARAVRMGWRPLHEWRGDPKAWRPADEYVRRGEEFLPILNSRAQKAEAEVASLRGQIAERDRDFEDRLRRLDRVSQIALQNQAQQIGQYYQSQMREAVRRGDEEGWDNLNRAYAKELGELQTRTAEAYQAPPSEPEKSRIDPETERTVRGWIGQQDWWQRDQEMTKEAVDYHGLLLKNKPWLTVEDNLAETDRYLDWKFPDKRGKRAPANGTGQRPPQQQHAPAVEGGTRQPAGAGRVKGWNELPPEAKKAGETFISQELYANDAKGRAEYAADYWSQE